MTKVFLHCDLLVIGAGPSGLMAALASARAGARVILADEDFTPGGRLNASAEQIDGQPACDWVAASMAELSALPNARILPRTTVFGAFDHGIYGAVERVSDHLPHPAAGKPRQTLWRIYSKRAVLCAGALERPIAFADNDRPGIMLAGALAAYAHRWAVSPASRVAIFTNNDSGHSTARDLMALGVDVHAVIDTRADAPKLDGTEVIAGGQITATRGRLGTERGADHPREWAQPLAGGRRAGCVGRLEPECCLVLPPARAAYLAGRHRSLRARTRFAPWVCPSQGRRRGALAPMRRCRMARRKRSPRLAIWVSLPARPTCRTPRTHPIELPPFWHVGGTKRAWLDFQNDVTVKDVKLAHQEGFRSVEHLKRYTTLGMATDQGKTSNLGGLAVMAELTGQSIEATGTTIFRPPYTPVAMGALAGRATGPDFKPTRKTPSHVWATEQGAAFVEVGQWLRAQYFPQPGETHWRQTVDREVTATRNGVGICDVTTLGKIDVQGADAAAFLNRIYCNGFAKLAVGRVRYGLMLREDGIAMDDGTAARLAEDHFVVTTTTANAVPVYRHMEFARQCLWPDMDVQLVSTTEAWAQVAVAGPQSRALLERIVDPAHDLSNNSFPFMACAEITVCGGLAGAVVPHLFLGRVGL